MDEDAVIEAEQEFLLLDDVVPEGKNIDIREEAGASQGFLPSASRQIDPFSPLSPCSVSYPTFF